MIDGASPRRKGPSTLSAVDSRINRTSIRLVVGRGLPTSGNPGLLYQEVRSYGFVDDGSEFNVSKPANHGLSRLSTRSPPPASHSACSRSSEPKKRLSGKRRYASRSA